MNLKSYFSHLVNYVIAAVTVVAGLDPALLPPQYAAIVAGAGLVATVAHHSYTAGGATATLQAVTKAVQASAVVLLIGVALVSSALLSACKTLPTPTQQSQVAIAVDVAAGFAIQQKDADPAVWKARAVQYKAIAVELKAVNDAGTATLATLQADLAPAIAKLSPAEQLGARALVAALVPYLQAQAQANATVQNTQAAVDVILAAVIDACTAYGG